MYICFLKGELYSLHFLLQVLVLMLLIAYMALPNVLLKRIIGRHALDHLADINFLPFSAKL
ncbi:hypothetical protein POPTR_018G100801v4 [Populus trichocarpa]|uniref:Uncharacterized protein n=1 Tax=Populus trichocarpa TaxID=3694 RepID=A0ACC0RPK1_POPTR|nr:hypothetical protein BDE02_18G086300 [Populus trichocarpa]KAI9378475.1 hypothetical protein POPTR_018G100801v4 [Populus trichocarpa]